MTNVECIADSIEPEVFPADNRAFTVSQASRFHDRARRPAFIMKGEWLDEAGFGNRHHNGREGEEGAFFVVVRSGQVDCEGFCEHHRNYLAYFVTR